MRGELLGNVEAIAEGADIDRARGPDPHGFARVFLNVGHQLCAEPIAPVASVDVLALELHHVGRVDIGGPGCRGHGDIAGDMLCRSTVQFGVVFRGALRFDGVSAREVAIHNGGVTTAGGGGVVGKGKAHSESAHSGCGEGGDGTDLE